MSWYFKNFVNTRRLNTFVQKLFKHLRLHIKQLWNISFESLTCLLLYSEGATEFTEQILSFAMIYYDSKRFKYIRAVWTLTLKNMK